MNKTISELLASSADDESTVQMPGKSNDGHQPPYKRTVVSPTTVQKSAKKPYECTVESSDDGKTPYKRTVNSVEINEDAVQMYGFNLEAAKAVDGDGPKNLRIDLRYSEQVGQILQQIKQQYGLKNDTQVFRLAVIGWAQSLEK